MSPALVFALVLAFAAPASAAAEAESEGGLVWHFLNLALMLGVLIYFARKPVLTYLAGRRDGIAKNLESSAALLAEAERRLEEWNRKAAHLDEQVAEIRAAAERAVAAERDRILADARAAAERIRQGAVAVAERELAQAREALRREAADLAVEVAGRILREHVDDRDRSRLLDEFIGRVEQRGTR